MRLLLPLPPTELAAGFGREVLPYHAAARIHPRYIGSPARGSAPLAWGLFGSAIRRRSAVAGGRPWNSRTSAQARTNHRNRQVDIPHGRRALWTGRPRTCREHSGRSTLDNALAGAPEGSYCNVATPAALHMYRCTSTSTSTHHVVCRCGVHKGRSSRRVDLPRRPGVTARHAEHRLIPAVPRLTWALVHADPHSDEIDGSSLDPHAPLRKHR